MKNRRTVSAEIARLFFVRPASGRHACMSGSSPSDRMEDIRHALLYALRERDNSDSGRRSCYEKRNFINRKGELL